MPCPDPFHWLIYLISVGCAKSAITLADNSQLPPSLKNCPGENGSCFPLPSTPHLPTPSLSCQGQISTSAAILCSRSSPWDETASSLQLRPHSWYIIHSLTGQSFLLWLMLFEHLLSPNPPLTSPLLSISNHLYFTSFTPSISLNLFL